MLAAGTYFGQVQGGKVTKAKSGSPQMEVEFLVINVWNGSEWTPIAPGTMRTIYMSLTDDAWPYSQRKLEALGFNGNFRDPDFGDEAKGEGVQLLCNHDSYNGKASEKWELANWGRKENEAAGADVLRTLEARWKSAAAPAKPAGRPTPPPARGNGKAATRAAPVAAPAATATAPETATVPETKEDVWAAYCESSNDKPDIGAWNKMVAAVEGASGKTEADFAAEEWRQVHAAIDGIPF